MAAALRGGLSASLSGIAFWSHDIGGFRGTPTSELYVRWAQFGLLSSHARCHGTTPREPWAFGETAADLFREYARLRYSLLPYIYTYAEEAARTGLPVVRPLVLEYQDDPTAQQMDTQYLLGEDLLVVPVFYETGTRSVYLPAGEWRAFQTGTHYEGGRTIEVDVELADLPLFVRAGSVVPRREPTQSVQPGTPAALTLEATLADGHAEGRYFDEDADAMVTATVDLDGDTLAVAWDETTAETVTVDVYAAEAGVRPGTVTVDGESLARVDADPDPGEWTVTDDGVVRVRR
jgi:alpha-D-xyloside xylohydrolase